MALIAAVFVFLKLFGGSSGSTTKSENFLSVTPTDSKSVVYLVDANGERKQVSGSGALYANNGSLVVESGGATAKLDATRFDIAANSEISYKVKTSDNGTSTNTIKVSKGMVWADSSSNTLLFELTNLSAKVPSGAIAMLEQTNTVFSSVYSLRGDVQIVTNVGQYSLSAGKKISLSSGEAGNASTNLSEKANDFDSSVSSMELFVRNDGETLLKASQTEDSKTKTEETTSTGATTGTGANAEKTGKYIAFTQPVDGATIKTATTNIMGTLLSADVSRVTLNDQDAEVSPVNETFSMENFALTNGINNIVYKAYSANGIELERGVLVVHGANTGTANTIVPENFPSLKDFVITSPSSNPYATTESYVKVQGTVPANTVSYITVNGYRLQRFVANSTHWYYHANASIGTIKEGTNLYHIKFYDSNNREIHTQIFTIIKDTPNANNNSDSPLFPSNQ